jgi:hypothetical protein
VDIWPLLDLHLEISPGRDLPSVSERPPFDVLVAAGDVIPRGERAVRWLLERVSDKPIVLVLGNHESYGEDIDRTLDKAREAALGTTLHVLENDFVHIDSVEFAGGTFWANYALYGMDKVTDAMRFALHGMNDFRRIRTADYSRQFRAMDALARHERTVDFLLRRKSIAPDVARVTVTHRSPDRFAVPANPPGGIRNNELLSASYSSSLDDLIVQLDADYWLSGQVHASNDRFVGRTRILSNSKCYGPHPGDSRSSWENGSFNSLFTSNVLPR